MFKNEFKLRSDLETIAKTYHIGNSPDMFIENICQDFEWPWIENKILSRSTVLDLGYGDGVSLSNLMKIEGDRGLSITLIEGAPTLVVEAKKHVPSTIKIVEGFFETFESDTKFDVIIASHVLEHVDDPVSLIKHLQRFLSTNGIIVGVVPNAESIHRRVAVEIGVQAKLNTLSERDHIVGHQRVYDLKSLEDDFEDAGMKIVESRGFFLKPLANFQLQSYSPEIIQALNVVSEFLPSEICANLGFVARKEFTGE